MWLFLLLAAAPEGWTDLSAAGLRVEARYATADNFTGAPLPGYEAPGAWLRTPVAEALLRVESAAKAEGYGLLVYDAYRPVRASRAMVDWATRTSNQWVIEQGYVAPASGHNKGHTVDLTLVSLATGTPLDMGTAWDTFSEASHTKNATGVALANRQTLARLMTAQGFRPYSKEWWHFGYPLEGATAIDVPYP